MSASAGRINQDWEMGTRQVNPMGGTVVQTIVSDVAEYVVMAQLPQAKLTPVAMCEQILHRMKTGAHKAVSLP